MANSIEEPARDVCRDGISLDVSVIVPMRNATKYIDRCLDSLLRQSYTPADYEIIVVENNSTDGSAGLVRKYSRVRLISEAMPGAYAARNRGVRAARGRILAFTDADCVPAEDWLAALVAPLASPEIGVVQGRRVFGGESQCLSMLAAYEAERAAFAFSSEGNGNHFGYTNNMAVGREVFDRCGPFLEIPRGADSVFVDRVVKTYSAGAVRFAREAVVRHLEITSVGRWIVRKTLYGRSLQQTRRLREYRRVGRMKIPLLLKRAADKGNFSAAGCAWLLVVICMGALAHDLGRLSGWWSRRTGAPTLQNTA